MLGQVTFGELQALNSSIRCNLLAVYKPHYVFGTSFNNIDFEGETKLPVSLEAKQNHPKEAFTNYVYKRRGVGGQKNLLFVNFYTIENVNGGGRWSKKDKSCKRSL